MELSQGVIAEDLVALVGGVRQQIALVDGCKKIAITGTGGAEYVGSSIVTVSGAEQGILLSESATELVTLVLNVVSSHVLDFWFISTANGAVKVTQYGG